MCEHFIVLSLNCFDCSTHWWEILIVVVHAAGGQVWRLLIYEVGGSVPRGYLSKRLLMLNILFIIMLVFLWARWTNREFRYLFGLIRYKFERNFALIKRLGVGRLWTHSASYFLASSSIYGFVCQFDTGCVDCWSFVRDRARHSALYFFAANTF